MVIEHQPERPRRAGPPTTLLIACWIACMAVAVVIIGWGSPDDPRKGLFGLLMWLVGTFAVLVFAIRQWENSRYPERSPAEPVREE